MQQSKSVLGPKKGRAGPGPELERSLSSSVWELREKLWIGSFIH